VSEQDQARGTAGTRQPRLAAAAPAAMEIEVASAPATARARLQAAAELAELRQRTDALKRKSRAASTQQAYEADWRRFAAWCARHGLATLPAAPETVELYLADHQHLAVPTLQRRLAAITYRHTRGGHPSPVADQGVQETWKGLVRERGRQPRRRATPMVTAVLRRLVATLDPPDGERPEVTARKRRQRTRDRALLTLGVAGALRRGELVALNVGDLRLDGDHGLVVALRSSKTDQEGRGDSVAIPRGPDPDTCPVRAWQAWLDAAGLDGQPEVPAFQWVDRHGNLRGRLSGHAVSEIIKRCAEQAGYDKASFSGHGPRAGLATAAAEAEVPLDQIMRHGRWKSARTVVTNYIRPAERWRGNVAGKIGL
jgi:integrase